MEKYIEILPLRYNTIQSSAEDIGWCVFPEVRAIRVEGGGIIDAETLLKNNVEIRGLDRITDDGEVISIFAKKGKRIFIDGIDKNLREYRYTENFPVLIRDKGRIREGTTAIQIMRRIG
jgi:hypothetical protein